MTYSQILYEVEQGICTITLHRPERKNAFTGTMGDELYAAFQAANADEAVKVIILTAGGDVFCNGVDMKALADPEEGKRITTTRFIKNFPLENYRNPKPTLCAFNGPAMGIGTTMSLSFDIRIASENAKFAVPFTRLNMIPGLGCSYLLPRLVGRGKALELLLGARTLSAAEAFDIGLIERVVPVGEAYATAKQLATELVGCNQFALRTVKDMINHNADVSVDEAFAYEDKSIITFSTISQEAARARRSS